MGRCLPDDGAWRGRRLGRGGATTGMAVPEHGEAGDATRERGGGLLRAPGSPMILHTQLALLHIFLILRNYDPFFPVLIPLLPHARPLCLPMYADACPSGQPWRRCCYARCGL
uniref:Predicted protein n=1 Tax=Hordeum vulgare subsp. vulgare TaxID=112509 RepID=F2DX48_HORVV|nr:predicted protein [Hordeum vulgare subsp. vulgare]